MFKDLYKKYKEIINYCVFGILATVINLVVKYALLFIFFSEHTPIQLQISIVTSWIASVLFAYFTNRKFVFESNNSNTIKELSSFIIARVSTLLLEMLIIWFFITFLKFNSDLYVILFTLISQVVVVIGNYILSKLFVFKKTDKN